MTADERYAARIHRVTDYIDANLASEFSLDELAGVASFSKYHFHRIFYLARGETLFRYIRRLRLERAAQLLVGRPEDPVLAVALDCGFDNASAFARAFREHFGVTASDWRAGERNRPHGEDDPGPELQLRESMVAAWTAHPLTRTWVDGDEVWESSRADGRSRRVTVVERPPAELAYVRHVGPYQADADLFARLFDALFSWAAPRNLVRYPLETYCVYHDAPAITPDEKLRVSVGLPIGPETSVEGAAGRMSISGGRYALAEMELADDEYGEAWAWTYGWWLPRSGYEPDDGLPFERYRSESPHDAHRKRQLVQICVPVRPARSA